MSQPEHCIACILSADGSVAGTGFLVSRCWLMTCAHVVEAAGGLDHGPLHVTFPHLGIEEPRMARCLPDAWYPNVPPASVRGMADIAILALDEPLADGQVQPPPFDPGDVTGVATDAFGYCIPEGQPAACTIDQIAGPGGWRYLSGSGDHHFFIEPGFSGAPLFWRDHTVRIVGMVAQYHKGGKQQAAMIPARLLQRAVDAAQDGARKRQWEQERQRDDRARIEEMSAAQRQRAFDQLPAALDRFEAALLKAKEQAGSRWDNSIGLWLAAISQMRRALANKDTPDPIIAAALVKLLRLFAPGEPSELSADIGPEIGAAMLGDFLSGVRAVLPDGAENVAAPVRVEGEMEGRLREARDRANALLPEVGDPSPELALEMFRDFVDEGLAEQYICLPELALHVQGLEACRWDPLASIVLLSRAALGVKAAYAPPRVPFRDLAESWAPEMVVIPGGTFLLADRVTWPPPAVCHQTRPILHATGRLSKVRCLITVDRYIGHLQIARVPDRHEPTTGELNDVHVLHYLDELDYTGWVDCEYRPKAGTVEGLGWMKLLA